MCLRALTNNTAHKKNLSEIFRKITPSPGPFCTTRGPAFGIKVADVVSRLTRVTRLSTFAGLKFLCLTHVPYVLGFQHMVVK